jgi:hypothetical protein
VTERGSAGRDAKGGPSTNYPISEEPPTAPDLLPRGGIRNANRSARHLQNHHSQIVRKIRGATRELDDRLANRVQNMGSRLGKMRPNQLFESFLAVLLTGGIHRLRHTVGEHDEHVAG